MSFDYLSPVLQAGDFTLFQEDVRAMGRRGLVLALALLAAVLAAMVGCGGAPEKKAAEVAPNNAAYPLVLTDGAGRQVKIERRPERIISLAPSVTETLFAIGAARQLVGVDKFSDYPPEAKRKEQVGGIIDPNLEKIVALKPDLVLTLKSNDMLPRLEKLGLTVFVVEPRNLAEVYDSIKVLGRITGTESAAGQVVAHMQARVRAVADKVAGLHADKRPGVFYEVWPEPLTTAGPNTFIHDLIDLAGGRNVFADAREQWPQVSAEVLVQRNPAVIITSFDKSVKDLKQKKRPGWEKIKAVEDGRVYLVDQNLIARPGPRIVDGLEQVARAVHPEHYR